MLNGSVELPLKVDNIGTASDGISLKSLSGLPDVVLLLLPDEEERHALEGIDEGEEEVLDEELMVDGVEIVERGHKVDEDFAELILAGCADAGALEKGNEELHHFGRVLLQEGLLALEQLYD